MSAFAKVVSLLAVLGSLLGSQVAAPARAHPNPAGIDWQPIGGYSIARTETTIGQFRRFASATGAAVPID